MTNEADKLLDDFCARIEKMCRYAPLDDKEVDDSVINDRNIVAGLYWFHRGKGEDEDTAAMKARTGAIRLVLNETLS